MKRSVYARLGLALLALALGLGAGPRLAAAQEMRKVGQDLKGRFDDAVVTVNVVMAATGDGSGRTFKGETCGTVIAPDGLTVVPLFTVDPAQVARRMAGPLGDSLSLGTQVRDLKITFGRQPQVAATIVLRDNDLNIALLRPLKKPEKPVKFVDLSKAETDVMALDPVITMTRLGNVAGREIALLPGTMQAVVTKPRKLYVPVGGFAGFGVPAFSVGGKVLGITTLQISLGGMNDMESGIFSLNMSHMGILPVILPADQLKELAAQAPEKAEPLPTAEPAPPSKFKKGLPGLLGNASLGEVDVKTTGTQIKARPVNK